MDTKEKMTTAILSLTEKIYDDVAHPTLSQLGKLISLPISFLGYPAELLLEKYKTVIQEAINKVPCDKRIQPKPYIAAPIIEHIKYAFDEEYLLEAFTKLLSCCIDMDYSNLIHPSFIEKIKQLSSFDLKVLEFISNQLMFCYCELFVECIFNETKKIYFPQFYLFTNMQDFNENSQQIDKSIDLLISLGILEVEIKETYKSEEYANRLIAFHELYKSTYESELFNEYLELCNENYYDEYDGTLYNHDQFFYGIELSPELENMILNGRNKDDITLDTIDSTRKIIKLTSYGEHFKNAVFREDIK